MPTKIEKDAISGQETTGHEWDGLKELNTPLPRWWLLTFYACIAFAAGMFILYPGIPYGPGYFRGLLGYSQRARVDADVRKLAAQRSSYMDKIASLSFADIRDDKQLSSMAATSGRIAFAENCKPCHGAGGGGNLGYPALAAGAWIWGGKLEDIQYTLTYGIRNGHENARDSQMPQFGADGLLTPEQIQQTADYVMTLYGEKSEKDLSAGKQLFADNCAACHGEAGQGNRELGAPRLAGHVHLHGDTRDQVVAQITKPALGVMPNWNTRLDAGTIKSLTLYVHGLGGGE